MSEWLRRLPDGTVTQRNPFTGIEVWTVPGRGNRPIETAPADVREVDPSAPEDFCAFCETRMLETTPEKARIVGGAAATVLENLLPGDLERTRPDFRVFGNLFEIVSLEYWKANHGYRIPERARRHQAAYLDDPAGREHLRRLLAVVNGNGSGAETGPAEATERFFGGCHDVVAARRHLVPGATRTDMHASSGTLTPDEHAEFVELTVRAMRRLYDENPFAAYVSVFQNWLRPAGASFDHLHKQLVTIDVVPGTIRREQEALDRDPDLYRRDGIEHALDHGLLIAENDHAIAVAGVGHRFPAIVLYSRTSRADPSSLTAAELRGVSDLLHACHAATGPLVPTNEEWHTLPERAPWRIVLKWRVSTPAGFEGATGINVNTIDPWALRDRVVPRLTELLRQGRIAGDIRVGTAS